MGLVLTFCSLSLLLLLTALPPPQGRLGQCPKQVVCERSHLRSLSLSLSLLLLLLLQALQDPEVLLERTPSPNARPEVSNPGGGAVIAENEREALHR